MAAAARFLHPTLQAVAARGECEGDFLRKFLDGALRTRLTEAETADHDGHTGTACAGPWTRILIHRATAIRPDDG
ncbi:hypothetical protein ACVJBD_004070 [Rhizobium mongolense]